MPGDTADWVALNMVRGIGPRSANQLLREFGNPSNVFTASRLAHERSGPKPESLRDLADREARARPHNDEGAHPPVPPRPVEVGGGPEALGLGADVYPNHGAV